MRNGRWLSSLLFILLSGLTATTTVAAGPGSEGKAAGGRKFSNKAYIVQLAEPPVAGYRGGIAGYSGTRPASGRKIDPTDPDVVRYRAHLAARQDAVLASAGGGTKLHGYGYAFNGFAADLTAAQVETLSRAPGVVAVTKDEARRLDTATTPAFLGLSGPSGFWATSGFEGEDVIIGIVDTGIWPEHPSFSDRVDGKLAYLRLPGWHGRCTPGEQFNASHCNQKLIGAQYYNQGFGGNAGVKAKFPYEILSPRDYDGHGTHTASTAGGNANVPLTGPAARLGSISGMAPRARIAAYKACWGTGDEGGCFNSDTIAAIDQAVADGVDVINFSISGTRTDFRNPVEIAFLFAADAGVFVAASAGNDGPATSTVAHPGPWLTTVAAGTHDRLAQGSATLGNGATYVGASLATAVPSKPLIAASAAGLLGADPEQARLCFAAVDNGGAAVLDPAKVTGKIVVCDRGVTPRPNKSRAVAEAGGVGMILVNTSPNSLNADLHFVPSVHLPDTDHTAILAYAATTGPTASISAASIINDPQAPSTAAFSSRGPLQAGGGDLLKPDLIAPGVDVLAGVAPPGNAGRLFDLLSGTSMSSPHVAGIAALLKEAKPGWSPMAIKSALMTTASDVLDGGTPNTNPTLIFRQGAGHVQPEKALKPGLVFDSAFTDWVAFICGVQPGGGCAGVTPIDASNLNVASIAIADLVGIQKVTRRVTNVGNTAATYTASVDGLSGFSVSLSPAPISIAPGETKSFELQFLRLGAAFGAYTGGQLRLTSDAGDVVRIPVVLRPIALAAPAQVTGNGGPFSYAVKFGYDGPFTATARGLVPPSVTADNVADDPTDGSCSLTSPNAKLIPVVIPVGVTYARFSLFAADAAPGADLDLCVFSAGQTLLASSRNAGAAEEVNLINPSAGTYIVVVHGYAVAGTSPFKLHTWLLGSADAGNMTVSAPAAAVTGQTGNISLGFSGLAGGTKYLGSISYGGNSGLSSIGPTIVRVDTP